MEEKINIAEILKDKKNGLRLYSPIFGECAFCCVRNDTNDICVKKHNGVKEFFDSKGLYYNTGEVMLFPSKEMRDWSKFFNKGDVLVCYEGKKPYYTVFDCFESNTYKDFNGKFAYDSYEDKCYQNEGNLSTNTFHKLSIADSEIYITKIEERFGGKLNLETLEIEKTQPEFKDGDIVTMHKKNCDIVFIFNRLRTEGSFYYYAFHSLQTNNTGVIDCHITLPYAWTFFGSKMNFATDSEKQQLFDALAKEGKAWDAEKKQIVDLKPKVELKPFDKVLVRDGKDEIWEPAFFFRYLSQFSGYNYQTVGGEWRVYCIPYIGNESLLGTTKDMEG